MPGLYFNSGIDDGFEKDMKRLNAAYNTFSNNVADKGAKNNRIWSDLTKYVKYIPIDDLKRSYIQLSNEMENVNKNTVEYTEKSKILEQVRNRIDGIGNSTKNATGGIKNLIKGLLGFSAIQKVLGFLKSSLVDSFNLIKGFSSKMSELRAITGAAGDDLKFLGNEAVRLSVKYGKSAIEIVDAMKLVGSAKPELLENVSALSAMTDSVLTLSKASGLDLAATTSNLATIMNQFGHSAAESANDINILAAGSQKGSVEVGYLAQSISKVGTIAKTAGLSLETTTAAMELFGEKGVQAETAGTGFKSVLIALQKDTNNYTNGVFDLNKALDNNKSISTDNIALSKKFGSEFFNIAQILIQNKDRFNELEVAVTGTNTAFEQAAINMDNLEGDLNKAGSAWDSLILKIEKGDGAISKALRAITQSFTNALNALGDYISGKDPFVERFKRSEQYSSRLTKDFSAISAEISKTTNVLEKQQIIQSKVQSINAEGIRLQKELNSIVDKTGKNKSATAAELARAETLKTQIAYLVELKGKVKELNEAISAESTASAKEAEDNEKEISEERIKAYKAALNAFEKQLSDQKRAYQQYNNDIRDLSDERIKIIDSEYAALLSKGKDYLSYLQKLLAKETNKQKQAIIQKEIKAVELENIVAQQQADQKQAEKIKNELSELEKAYRTYSQKRLDIEVDYQNKISKLRAAGYIEQSQQAQKALQTELKKLDDSILAQNTNFQTWVSSTLPEIAKKGVEALSKELQSVDLTLRSEWLDPEQVLVYKKELELLQKEIEKKLTTEEKSPQAWKDTLELINGVNSLVNQVITDLGVFDERTKRIVGTFTKIGGGLANLVTGIQAVGKAATALEKSSAILAVISTSIQLVSTLINASEEAAKAREQAYVNELESIQAANLAIIEQNKLYKEGNEFFADDKWGTALAGLDAYNLAIKYQDELLNSIIDKNLQVEQTMYGALSGADSQLASLKENALSASSAIQVALGSIQVRTKDKSGFANFVGFKDEYKSLLDVYPDLIDANGELNESLAETIISTADLGGAEKEQLSNLLEITKVAKEAYAQFGNYISGLFGGVADEVTSVFQEMYETGNDSMANLEQSFSDMIESFTRDAIEFALLSPYLNELNEATKALGEKYAKGEVTSEELQSGIINSLGSFYDQMAALQPEIIQAFERADQLAAAAGFESAFNPESTTNEPILDEVSTPISETTNIVTTKTAGAEAATITQETGSLIEGRLSAIMLSNLTIAEQGRNMLEYAIQHLTYMKAIKVNTDYLPEIAANTRKTYQKLESI